MTAFIRSRQNVVQSELANLAGNLWRPVGPVGIEGRDYDALVIYEADRADEEAAS